MNKAVIYSTVEYFTPSSIERRGALISFAIQNKFRVVRIFHGYVPRFSKISRSESLSDIIDEMRKIGAKSLIVWDEYSLGIMNEEIVYNLNLLHKNQIQVYYKVSGI